MKMSRGRQNAAMAVGALLLIAVLAVGEVVMQIHARYGEWRLTPTAAPPKLPFNQRDYSRGGTVIRDPAARVRGRTAGGGTIYTVSGIGGEVVIWVQVGRTTYEYSLMGGP